MKDDFETLRSSFLSLSESPATADCPEPAEIWEGANGRLSARVTRRLADHLGVCPTCREAWLLAGDLRTALPDAAPGRVRPAPATARAPWKWAVAATLAAAAIVLAVVLPMESRRARATSPFRGGATGELESLVSENRVVPRSQVILRWKSAAPGTRYRVRVTTEDLMPLASASDLGVARFQVPEDALRNLPPGSRILWQISATLPDGRYETSGTFVIRIR